MLRRAEVPLNTFRSKNFYREADGNAILRWGGIGNPMTQFDKRLVSKKELRTVCGIPYTPQHIQRLENFGEPGSAKGRWKTAGGKV